MTMVNEEQQALDALNYLAEASQQVTVGEQSILATDLAEVIREVCQTYTPLKPVIQAVLPLIERIPVIGSKIATTVRLLMTLLNRVCSEV
jgi:hypothetical protein